jgi:hypothetical protein
MHWKWKTPRLVRKIRSKHGLQFNGTTIKLGYYKLGYNKLGYNKLGYNELGHNELGYNQLDYTEHPVITNEITHLVNIGH